MAKVSLILCTARDDFPLLGLPKVHLFQRTLDSLEKQSFTDFEFIISDCRYEKRPKIFNENKFRGKNYAFPIKHIPVKPYSPWLQRGMWGGTCARNRGIIAADDDCELLIFLDDCCEFSEDFLQLYWDWYRKGCFAMALVLYNKGGKPIFYDDARKTFKESTDWRVQHQTFEEHMEKLDKVFRRDERFRDSRWRYVENCPNGVAYVTGTQYYGYSASSMEAILKVNGWDENFDGDKSMADVDLGWRLEMAGYKDFILDAKLTVIENFHEVLPKDTIWYKGRPIRQNYNLMLLNRRKRRYRANSYKLTKEEFDWVRRAAWLDARIPKDVPLYTPEDPEWKLQQWWWKNPPIYSIREARLMT